MAKTKFPYQAFILTPAMLVKEVTVVGQQYASASDSAWHKIESGAAYHTSNLHKTREAAIEAGEKSIAQREARLVKTQANLAKHKANLAKTKAA